MKSIEKQLIDLCVANFDMLEEGLPQFINRQRSGAIESFNYSGLPDKRIEKYKYSDIRSKYQHEYEKYFSYGVTTSNDNWCELPIEGYETEFFNGFSKPDTFTTLENGVMYGSIREASKKCPEIVETHYNKLADNENDSPSALNTAFMQDGFFLYVPANQIVRNTFVVKNRGCGEEDIFVYNRSMIVIERGAQATMIIDHCDNSSKASYLSNNLSEIFAAQGAVLKIVEIQRGNSVSTTISNNAILQAENSNVQSSVITIGAGFIRNNVNVKLEGKGAENHTYGLAIANGEDHIDNSTNIEHNVPDCTSFEKYKGIASDNGTVAFNGRILVAKDAQHTQAFQENHNLQLSDTAHIYSKPQLEIYADDVKCSHGATVGQLDPEAIFYMRQRGLSENNAKKLQMYGFVNDIVDRVEVESIGEFVARLAMDKIDVL